MSAGGELHVDMDLCADELPHGLPMFGVKLAIPVWEAQVQIFRTLKSRTAAALVLHDLVVHPGEFELLGPSDTSAYLQAHGRLWALRCSVGGLLNEIAEVRGPIRLRLEGGEQLRVIDAHGDVLARESHGELARDDRAAMRVLQTALRQAFGQETISAALVRAYPGRTSAILETRPFPTLFASDQLRDRQLNRPMWPSS